MLLQTIICSKSYNGSYPQEGLAMETFLVHVVLVFGKETKVLLCLRIEKENKVKKKMMNPFCVKERRMKTRKVE